MSITANTGSRQERIDRVRSINNDQWNLNTIQELLLGLWDHGTHVNAAAQMKLLKLAVNPNIQPATIHPIDLALLHVKPKIYEQTFIMVRKMKEIGLPAKEICFNFFNEMKSGPKEILFASYEILKDTELGKVVAPIIKEIK